MTHAHTFFRESLSISPGQDLYAQQPPKSRNAAFHAYLCGKLKVLSEDSCGDQFATTITEIKHDSTENYSDWVL